MSDEATDLEGVKAADTAVFADSEKWYIVGVPWLVRWIRYTYVPGSPHPGPVDNDTLLTQATSVPSSPRHSMDKDGIPVGNKAQKLTQLCEVQPRRHILPRMGLALKKDYRAIAAPVWDIFLKSYGSETIISIQSVDGLEDPSLWNIDTTDFTFAEKIGRKDAEEVKHIYTELNLSLVPHVHTVKCNRRVVVCDTPGKFREREWIRAGLRTGSGNADKQLVHEESFERVIWWRRRKRLGETIDSFRDISTAHALDSWERISGAEGKMKYQIQKQDDSCFICCQYVPHLESSNNYKHLMVSNIVGPCEKSGPMIDTIRVEGEPIVGGCLVAVTDYWGGDEGPSEYQWTRVLNGERSKSDKVVLDPTKNMGIDPFDPSDIESGLARGDPRFRRLTSEDVGAKFKVTCLPARRDGLTGEPKTSRPTKKVKA